jgi:shikimate 5-dehydrogenase
MPDFFFIGVTTAQSSIMKLFPLWMAELGRPDVRIRGVDLKLHDAPENYRAAVTRIKNDPMSPGGLVTTHKIHLLEAARDLFDYLDPDAMLCGEVSCLSKNGYALEGYATDPLCAGLSLDAILGPDYFGRTGGEFLCLGAGGAAAAILLHLARKRNPADRPRRMILVNRSPQRLASLRALAAGLDAGMEFDWLCNDSPERNDELMAGLTPGSVVVNATGMGKDLPGCPVTAAARFPRRGVAWELNYRGALDFLKLAKSQRESRELQVEDGWQYFLHGWTQVIGRVLGCRIDDAMFGRLADIANRRAIPPARQTSASAPGPDD